MAALHCSRPATACGSTLTSGGSTRIVPEEEWRARRAAWTPHVTPNQTPWEELYRANVGQLADGGCLEFATSYQRVARALPRDNH